MNKHPLELLMDKSSEWNYSLLDEEFAKKLDDEDEMSKLRDMFYYPKMKGLYSVDQKHVKNPDDECIYFCGHSLGLMAKNTEKFVIRELEKWKNIGVEGHTKGELPWALCDECVVDSTAKLVGALPKEVGVMNGLTVNEHLLLISFYQPTSTRYKILLEEKAFPSDHYCIESQIRQRGLEPKDCMVIVGPRKGEYIIRHEDILEAIEREGDSIAAILLGGVHYFTGQLFDMADITKAGHAKGCYVGFDLAHAIGNVTLSLHDWDVDFACWCTYKYLCSGAGGIAGLFIHEKFENHKMPQLLGWWSHKMETRFEMTNEMDLSPLASGYRISNPPGLLAASYEGCLSVYEQTTMSDFRKRSQLMSAYFEHLLLERFGKNRKKSNEDRIGNDFFIEIITPSNPEERGCQLSITTSIDVLPIFAELSARGVLLDKRMPNVLRLSSNPLYNKFVEIHRFIDVLEECIVEVQRKSI